jgi:hypothetical protein
VDLEALYTKADYMGLPGPSAVAGASKGGNIEEAPIDGDVFGYRPVREDFLEKLVGSLGTLEELVSGIHDSMSPSFIKHKGEEVV